MKPSLKPPGTKRFKVKYAELLSNFAFNFNLCPYNMDLLLLQWLGLACIARHITKRTLNPRLYS
jgi:hypothetical protein